MHTRGRAFSKLFSITCHDIYKLSKCPIKKVVVDNINEVQVRDKEEK
jgi:hypothetical protein